MPIPSTVEIEMRGGNHPDKEMDEVEGEIMELALRRFLNSPVFMKKGLKWTYNWTHFNTFWMTRSPKLINLLHRLEPYPDYIEIEVTTACNLKCILCEHTYWKEPVKNMPFEQFKFIVDQFPNLKWIGLTGIGESFLNKDFIKMLEYVKSGGTYVEFYDTFYFIDDETSKKLVELGVEHIFVSFDAATKETYEKIRVNSDFERVVENIKRLDKWKKKLNSYYPELCFHFTVTKDNIHEAIEYLEFLDSLGIDIHMVQYTRMLHEFKEVKNQFIEVPKETIEKILKRAKELNIQIMWNANIPHIKPPINECTAWWMPFIFVDGTVIPCCCLNEQNDRDWQRATSLGNVFKKPFREIWDGKEYKRMRKALIEKRIPRNCVRCSIYKMGERK